MNLLFSLYVVALFIALTPGVLLTLPKRGSKLTVAIVHGLVFATILYFTYGIVRRMTTEGFDAASDRKAAQAERQQAIKRANDEYARQEAAVKSQQEAARKARQEEAVRARQEKEAAMRAKQEAAKRAQQEAAAKRAQQEAAARKAQQAAAEAAAMRASQRAAEAAARAEKAKANANRYL